MSNGINPLFWGSSAGAGAAEAGAAGVGATAAGFPVWLIPIIISLLGTMFEKDPLEEAQELKSQMGILGFKQPYQSPYAEKLDPVMLQALLAQMGRTSNWGWPAGKGMDTSFIMDALEQLRAGKFGSSTAATLPGGRGLPLPGKFGGRR